MNDEQRVDIKLGERTFSFSIPADEFIAFGKAKKKIEKLLEEINVPQPDIPQLIFFIFLISILLIFKKSRFLLKKIILVNFILISLYLWHLQINNISVDDQFHIYRYFGLNDLNLINLFILVAIEISFYTWSF